MRDDLRDFLLAYKELTEEMLECLKKDEFDEVNNILDKRQQVIDKIKDIENTIEEINIITEELAILEIQKSVNNLMLSKKEEINQEIQQLSKSKNASKVYNRNLYNSSVLNKKG